MGTAKGTKYDIGITHKAALAWHRSAKAGDELRAGRGLYLKRTAGGAQWLYRYESPVTGKQVRAQLWANDELGLISFPDASLDEARTRAAAMRAAVAAGIDPVIRALEGRQARERAVELARLEHERQARAAVEAAAAAALRVTVRTLFGQWQRAELSPQVLSDGTRTGRKDGGEWVRQSFERRLFPKVGETAAADVRKSDLLGILDECKVSRHRRTANVLLADMRQMFRFAVEREIVVRNPLDGIKRATIGGKDVARDRVLGDHELKLLWSAVPKAKMAPRSATAVWLILATACRVGEAMAARWEQVDFERRTWHLPETKNQRSHLIHLSGFALQQLKVLHELREITKDASDHDILAPWLFPNSAANGPVDIKSFGKQLADRQRAPERQLRNRAKSTEALLLPGGRWTAHDLRRTSATLMARLGISTDVIEECLNHKLQSKMARVYIQDRRLLEQAHAFDALGSRLQAVVLGEATSNVIPLRGAA
jgi:integrase